MRIIWFKRVHSHWQNDGQLIHRKTAAGTQTRLLLTNSTFTLVTPLKLTCHFYFQFSRFLFRCFTSERIFTFSFLSFFSLLFLWFPHFSLFYCNSHLLCNCEQGNGPPPFLRNICYLHAFSNFQQSQFLLEWIRWFPFLMYQLACLSIAWHHFWFFIKSFFSWSIFMFYWYLTFSFNHLFTF